MGKIQIERDMENSTQMSSSVFSRIYYLFVVTIYKYWFFLAENVHAYALNDQFLEQNERAENRVHIFQAHNTISFSNCGYEWNVFPLLPVSDAAENRERHRNNAKRVKRVLFVLAREDELSYPRALYTTTMPSCAPR